MVSPAVFNMDEATAGNNHVVGPLTITFSIIALWQINRKVIRANVALGAWMLISFLIFPFTDVKLIASNTICAILLVLLPFVKRKAEKPFGGGWSSLFQKHPEHLRAAKRKSFGS